jgi:hypothetical protein
MRMQSWRLYGLQLHEFGTWCWAVPTGYLLWQHLCPRWQSYSKAESRHFLELKTEMEVLRSRHSADLTEDEADALWI